MRREGRSTRRWLRPLLLALLVQAGVLLLAGVMVVWVIEDKPVEEPIVPVALAVEPAALQPDPPRYDLSDSLWQQAAQEAMILNRIQLDLTTEMSIPALPALPESTVDLSEFTGNSAMEGWSREVQSLLSTGAGLGVTSFFGVEATGKRILILFDISQTVVNKSRASGVPMSQIRDETIRLIEGLDWQTQFGLIQFSRVYETFQERLIPATKGNKEIAIQWMRESFAGESGVIPGRRGVRDYPRGIETVLQAALQMQPEVIFLLSDGAFWRSLDARRQEMVPYADLERVVSEWKSRAQQPVRLHVIGFQVQDKTRNGLRRLVDMTGGTMREIGK